MPKGHNHANLNNLSLPDRTRRAGDKTCCFKRYFSEIILCVVFLHYFLSQLDNVDSQFANDEERNPGTPIVLDAW